MDRQTAILLSFIFLIIFILLAYYGAKITVWSSINFGLFAALIILNLFYPVTNLPSDTYDSLFYLYIFMELIGFATLAVYVMLATLSDVRN
jgi:uncharacterized membrane protein YagU involved in acid resistance